MNQNKEKWVERLLSIKDFLFHKRAKKTANITYSVVWNLFLLFMIFGLIGMSFAGGAGAGYFASLVKDEPIRPYEDMKKHIYNYEETTEVYFDNNVYLGKLRSDLDRVEITLDEVSEHLRNAVIATEDEYFYEHNGVVPKAILRAIFQEVTNSSIQTGGSTLTQQLIKNQILTNEVSFDRKAKEILLAMRLEKFFEKDEILEAYLNMATFGRNSSGRNIAGVQTAAKGIFGVDAKDLNLAQAAFIAGLPQSPFRYTPFTNKAEVKTDLEPGLNRMQTVLKRMLDGKFITQEQYDEAIKYDIRANLTPYKASPTDQYPWLTSEIELRATDILLKKLAMDDGYEESDLTSDENLQRYYKNLANQNLRQNGYRIYTTIDKEIYDKMQEVAKTYEYYGPDKPQIKKNPDTGENEEVMEPVETGAVLIENKTGKIISFVGGRDHTREQTNHATFSLRPNGSTMKPLLVYAPAMELGLLQPGSIIADVPLKLGEYEPKNYGGGFDGLMSARHALKMSRNIPAVKTYVSMFDQRPISYLEKMGFSSLRIEDGQAYSLSLGGMTNGVTVEENVNAYATFANSGQFIDAYMIEKIETNDGEVIYQHESEAVDVFTPQTAYLTIDIMRDVIRSGTATSINRYLSFNADWAGKTGTGQDYRDAWFVATNPNVTFGTWIGYDTPKSMYGHYKGLSYSQRNLLLWSKLMNVAYESKPDLVAPKDSFNMPGGLVKRQYCALSGLLPSDICKEAGLVAEDIFNAKFAPTEVDDNLERGKYLIVDEKAYRVPETAPEEFVQEGIMVKKEYLEKNDLKDLTALNDLLPKNEQWTNIVVTEPEPLQDNGIIPTKVTGLKLANNTLSWSKHEHTDVIGYRIFRAGNFSTEFEHIASIPAKTELKYTLANQNPGAYYVIAVDISGNVSPNSDIMKNGNHMDQPEELPSDEGDNSEDDPSDGEEEGEDDGEPGDDEIIPGLPGVGTTRNKLVLPYV
jgi:penicillin-binding protein 1B